MHHVGGGEARLVTSSLLLVSENWSHREVPVVVVVWAWKGNETGITTAKHQVGGGLSWDRGYNYSH